MSECDLKTPPIDQGASQNPSSHVLSVILQSKNLRKCGENRSQLVAQVQRLFG